MPFLQLHLRHCLSHRGLPQQTGSLSTLLLIVLEAAKFKIKALADLYPVRACLQGYWVTESCLLILASHARDKGSNTLISLLARPFTKSLPWRLNRLPQVPAPTLGVRVSTFELGATFKSMTTVTQNFNNRDSFLFPCSQSFSWAQGSVDECPHTVVSFPLIYSSARLLLSPHPTLTL